MLTWEPMPKLNSCIIPWQAQSSELTHFSKMNQYRKISQLTFSWPHVMVKQFQQSLLLIAVLVSKWCRIAYRATNARLPHVINPFVLGTYWVHYLHTVLFFYFCVAFSLPKKFINLHAILGAHLWIGLNLLKACPFLFTLYACLGNYADIWARASKI